MKKTNYILIHAHQYGTSHYLFSSNNENLCYTYFEDTYIEDIGENLNFILSELDIDFEPNKGETLTIDIIDLEDVPYFEMK